MVTTFAETAETLDEASDEDWLELLDEDESPEELADSTDESSVLLDCEVEDLDSNPGSEAMKDCKSVPATRACWEEAKAGVDWLRNANPR
jgi:hypothetical protein